MSQKEKLTGLVDQDWNYHDNSITGSKLGYESAKLGFVMKE